MKKILLIITLICLSFTKVNAEEVNINLFYGDGCPHCEKEQQFLKVLKYQLGDNINIKKYEVWNNQENNELLSKVRETLNETGDSVPYTVINNKPYTGYNDDLQKEIKYAVFVNLKETNPNIVKLVKNNENTENLTSKTNPTIHFSLLGETDTNANASLVAFTEGISDAINLGSLWIMLFLSGILLSIYNKKKRWLLGSIFVFISTITYMILSLTNVEFTINQTTFIRSFISIIAIFIAAISIDAHLKINIPKKSILQILQELFGKKQMLVYIIGIIITSVITTFALVNQTGSSPALFKTFLEIQNITNFSYALNIIIYFVSYLIASLILFAVLNTIIKEIIIENTIGTYNRLIAGIILLIAAAIILFVPSAFMMV